MHRSCLALLVAAALAGCASPPAPPAPSAAPAPAAYRSTYQVGSIGPDLSAGRAEKAHRDLANAAHFQGSDTRRFDAPVRFLRAPQPVMAPEDIDGDVTGRVTVEILFGESGAVANTRILESTKASLSDAVLSAVRQWRIAPLAIEGRPTTLLARQSFEFRTASKPGR